MDVAYLCFSTTINHTLLSCPVDLKLIAINTSQWNFTFKSHILSLEGGAAVMNGLNILHKKRRMKLQGQRPCAVQHMKWVLKKHLTNKTSDFFHPGTCLISNWLECWWWSTPYKCSSSPIRVSSLNIMTELPSSSTHQGSSRMSFWSLPSWSRVNLLWRVYPKAVSWAPHCSPKRNRTTSAPECIFLAFLYISILSPRCSVPWTEVPQGRWRRLDQLCGRRLTGVDKKVSPLKTWGVWVWQVCPHPPAEATYCGAVPHGAS